MSEPRHAIVTGASRGIGAAIARALAREGCALTLIARGEAELRALAAELAPAAIEILAGDLGDPIAAEKLLARAKPAAILVNNVGHAETAPFAKTDPALFRRMIDINLTSAYLATRAATPAMIAARWGRVINIASTAGVKPYPYVSAYVAAKHALVGLTRALALEFAKTGVTVNAIAPGYTDTPMISAAAQAVAAKTGKDAAAIKSNFAAANPMGRLIAPEEVAAAVAWLCRDEAASITGAVLPIAGGEI